MKLTGLRSHSRHFLFFFASPSPSPFPFLFYESIPFPFCSAHQITIYTLINSNQSLCKKAPPHWQIIQFNSQLINPQLNYFQPLHSLPLSLSPTTFLSADTLLILHILLTKLQKSRKSEKKKKVANIISFVNCY